MDLTLAGPNMTGGMMVQPVTVDVPPGRYRRTLDVYELRMR